MNNHIPEIGFNLLFTPTSYLGYFNFYIHFYLYTLFASSAESSAFTDVQLYTCNYTYMYSTWLVTELGFANVTIGISTCVHTPMFAIYSLKLTT